MPTRISTGVRDAILTAILAQWDAGSGFATVQVRTGAQVADVATAPTGTLLVTFTLNDPVWLTPAGGIALLDADPEITATAVASGTAGWFRVFNAAGDAIQDGECKLSGGQLNFSILGIIAGDIVKITGGQIVQPTGA